MPGKPENHALPPMQQVFHGTIRLRFDEEGAAAISGTKGTLLEGVLHTWPALQVCP